MRGGRGELDNADNDRIYYNGKTQPRLVGYGRGWQSCVDERVRLEKEPARRNAHPEGGGLMPLVVRVLEDAITKESVMPLWVQTKEEKYRDVTITLSLTLSWFLWTA